MLLTLMLVGLSSYVCGDVSYMNVAGVLPLTGYLSQDMIQAYMGYEFFCDYLEQQGGFSIFHNEGEFTDKNGDPYRFAFNCSIYDNQGSVEIHQAKYRELLREDSTDFYVGSHIYFEYNSSQIVNGAQKLLTQCCVGPDALYQGLNLDYQFGVQVSNTRYTQLIMKEFGFAELSSMSVLRQSDNAFTMSTCQSAIEQAQDRGVQISVTTEFSREAGDDLESIVDQFLQDTKEAGAMAVVACVQADDATYLTRRIDELRIPLKAFFATAAPWYQSYIEQVGNLSEYALSAGQWHMAMANDDVYFQDGNKEYVDLFTQYYDGQIPTYVAAGASVVLEVYMIAIQNAFLSCDLTNSSGDPQRILYDPTAIQCTGQSPGTIGYELVHTQLKRMNIQTFFGKIGFNKYRRNYIMEPATIQIQRNVDEDLESMCVLPVNAANAVLKLPQPNRYKQECPTGYKQPGNDFQPCIPCPAGMKRCEACASTDCDYCARDEYNDDIGQAECKVCPSNTRATVVGATNITQCQCKPNFFQPELLPGEPCLPCVTGGVCDGELFEMYPMKGFWMDPEFQLTVHACNPAHICIGGPGLECAAGYSGRLCESCAQGYYQFFSACRNCPSNLQVILQLCGIGLAWWIINAVISRQMETFDVILNWIQLLSVVGEFEMNWPSTIYTILQLAALFAFEVDIIELDCLLPEWSFLDNFIVQLLLPVVVALIAAISFLCTYVIYKLNHQQVGQLQRAPSIDQQEGNVFNQMLFLIKKNLRRLLGLLFVIPETKEDVQCAFNLSLAVSLSFVSISYLTLVKYSFDAFKCIDISGVSVMKTSVDIQCDSETYQTIRILGYIGIVFYVILFPIFAFVTLQYLKRQKAFHYKVQLERFGWLYHRYEVEWYWYEMSQIGHRLIFVLILVFIDSPSMQSSLATLVTTGLLMLHIYSRPYIDVVLDILHTFLQVALMLVILSGLVFYNPEVQETDRTVMEYFILITLGLFGLIFLGFLVRNLFEKMVHLYASWRIKRVIGKVSEDLGEMDNVRELLHTFELRFLIPWVRSANEEELAQLNTLAMELAEYVSNESDTSYLSLTKTGRWWRFLSQRFPEVIDFLAVVDDDTRAHFIKFVEVLYQYFFRHKGSNNIYEMITWEDRAAVAQWLALASDESRQLYNNVVKTSFRYAKGEKVATDHFMRVLTYGRMSTMQPAQTYQKVESAKGREMKRMGSSFGRMFSKKSFNQNKTKLPAPLENRVTDRKAPTRLQMLQQFSSTKLLRTVSKTIRCSNNLDLQSIQDIQEHEEPTTINIQQQPQDDNQQFQTINDSVRDSLEIQLQQYDDNNANSTNLQNEFDLLQAVSDRKNLRVVRRYASSSGLAPTLEGQSGGQLGGMGPWISSNPSKPEKKSLNQLSRIRSKV